MPADLLLKSGYPGTTCFPPTIVNVPLVELFIAGLMAIALSQFNALSFRINVESASCVRRRLCARETPRP